MINKKLIIIMIILVVLVVGVGIGGYFMLNRNKVGTSSINSAVNNVITSKRQLLPKTESNGKNIAPIVKKEITQQDRDISSVNNLVNFFVSMLGSYSTDAHFKNVIDLKPFMTAKMKIWADNFIKRNLDKTINKDNSITTKVYSSEILTSTATKMTILVKTRRSVVSGETSKVYNQEAIVIIDKIASNWLVDSVKWK